MNKANVFVTQLPSRHAGNGQYVPTLDVTPAREFGELIFVLPQGMSFPTGALLSDALHKGLAPFRPEVDFLLPLGDPAAMTAAGAVIAAAGAVTFNVLRWDRHTSRYCKLIINL